MTQFDMRTRQSRPVHHREELYRIIKTPTVGKPDHYDILLTRVNDIGKNYKQIAKIIRRWPACKIGDQTANALTEAYQLRNSLSVMIRDKS
jgi:hypothetical protein